MSDIPKTTDKALLEPGSFSASLVETPGLPLTLTVTGEAIGDYRVQQVALIRSKQQADKHILVLEVKAELGPVQNPHPDIERVFPLQYTENPAAHRYTRVLIENGTTHFSITVEDIL